MWSSSLPDSWNEEVNPPYLGTAEVRAWPPATFCSTESAWKTFLLVFPEGIPDVPRPLIPAGIHPETGKNTRLSRVYRNQRSTASVEVTWTFTPGCSRAAWRRSVWRRTVCAQTGAFGLFGLSRSPETTAEKELGFYSSKSVQARGQEPHSCARGHGCAAEPDRNRTFNSNLQQLLHSDDESLFY